KVLLGRRITFLPTRRTFQFNNIQRFRHHRESLAHAFLSTRFRGTVIPGCPLFSSLGTRYVDNTIQHLPSFWPGRRPPRLYSPLRRDPLARSRKKYPADPQRPIPHRESSRRQSRLSRFDARLSSSHAPRFGAPSRSQQFHPVDRLVPHRHPHFAFLWNLHPRCAGRRRSDSHFQWLDHAEKQRASRSRRGGPEKSESRRCFPQRLLPAHPSPHGWTGFHFHGHHPRRQRASSSWPQLSRDSRRRDWFRASRGEHLHLLRFRRSSRRDHRRKRHEHHPSALFLPSCLHRRPDLLERRECL